MFTTTMAAMTLFAPIAILLIGFVIYAIRKERKLNKKAKETQKRLEEEERRNQAHRDN